MEEYFAQEFSNDSTGQVRHRPDGLVEEDRFEAPDPSKHQSTRVYSNMEGSYAHEFSNDSAGKARYRQADDARNNNFIEFQRKHLEDSYHQREYYKLQEQRYKAESFQLQRGCLDEVGNPDFTSP